MKRSESFAEARRRRVRSFRFFRLLAGFFVAYSLVTLYGLKPFEAASQSMSPTIQPGDRVFVLPLAYAVANPLNGMRISHTSPQRGDIVLLDPPWVEVAPWPRRIADSLLRFVTAQRIGLKGDPLDRPVMKRVVALPGDSVRMENFIIYVKAAGSTHFLTEYEVSGRSYDIQRSGLPDGWSQDMPLSGTMDEVFLKPGFFFVVGDSRTSSADSRFFGPVDINHIRGKVAFRYWPFGRPLHL